MKKKIALITGITGQDGSYLAELLLSKNYEVHGLIRKSSSINTKRIDHIYQGPFEKNKKLFLHYSDLSDGSSINKLIHIIMPDEIYNLAAQSHVAVSFDMPEYTLDINANGLVRILETIRSIKKIKKIKLYQASSSELFGYSKKSFQNELTPFYPKSPYATSKLAAYWFVKNYRESYDIFASNGILFNHESPRRGDTFVTKKIVKALCNISKGSSECLILGNIYSKRDWGHAKNYVEGMWKILQHKKPDDFVIATGKQYSVKQFINKVLNQLGIIFYWKGKGFNEKCYINGRIIIKIDKRYFRPNEVDSLKGKSDKIKKILKFHVEDNIDNLIKDMIRHEFS